MNQKIILRFLIIGYFIFFGCVLYCQRGIEALPLELFFQEPTKKSFQISPSGNYISYIGIEGKSRHLFLIDSRSYKTRCVSRSISGEIEKYIWLKEKVLAVQIWNPQSKKNKVYQIDLNSKKLIPLTNNDSLQIKLLNTQERLPGYVFLQLNDGFQNSWQPYGLNLDTGYLERLAENSGKVEDWILDHMGRCRIAIIPEGSITHIQYRKEEKKTFQLMLSFDNVEDFFQPLFFSHDNKNIYAYSNLNRDRVVLVEYDPIQKREIKILYEDEIYDLFGDDEVDFVFFSQKQNQLGYIFYTTWKRKYHFFNNRYKNLVSKLHKKFNHHVIRIVSSNVEENIHIIKISSDRLCGIYYLFNETKNKFTKLYDAYPWLKESHMAYKTPIHFSSRDGLTIHGYITLPPVIAAKNLPLVVIPHGGPRWRDCWEMGRFTETQLFANRGYAVLQVNFRGSSGYGKKFTVAGFKQNGLNVQNDISDGVYYLIEKNIADKKKIAILGGSYGGYAVLAGLTFTPDLYACGVDLFGVSNFFTFLNSLPPWFDKESMYRTVGHPEKDRELLKKTSPLFHINRIRVPVLIAQGGKDPVVKKSESDQMVDALKKQGIPVQYIFKKNEGHGYFRNKKNRLELWSAIDCFLKKHISKQTH